MARVKKEIMFWLKIHALVETNTAGDVLMSGFVTKNMASNDPK